MEGIKSGGGFSPAVHGMRPSGDDCEEAGGKELPGNQERIDRNNSYDKKQKGNRKCV